MTESRIGNLEIVESSIEHLLPGVATFDVSEPIDNLEMWVDKFASLELSTVFPGFDMDLAPHPVKYEMTRAIDGKKRDPWAGDHMDHVDLTHENVQPVVTGIYCAQAGKGAPGTEIVDTSTLFALAQYEGFFDRYLERPADLYGLHSVFADGTYYREALPYFREQAIANGDSDTAKQLEAAIHATLLERSADPENPFTALEEVADAEDAKHGITEFPLIGTNPFTGDGSIFVDGGGRCFTIRDPETGKDYRQMLLDFRLEYLSDRDALREAGLIARVEWKPGKVVIFPQNGTMHRALPGNNAPRKLYLGFLATE